MVIYPWHDFKPIATWFRLLWHLSFPIIVWFRFTMISNRHADNPQFLSGQGRAGRQSRMTSKAVTTELIEIIKQTVAELTLNATRRNKQCRYADLRLEVVEEKRAGAENGTPKFSREDCRLAFGVRVLAGDQMVAPGYFGQILGKADLKQLPSKLSGG